MSAKKSRPERGTPIAAGMSRRDMAAALGVSTAEICRWVRMAELPEGELTARLSALQATGRKATSSTILCGAPVPARGRVVRAQGIVANMTPEESAEFLVWVMGEVRTAFDIIATREGARP